MQRFLTVEETADQLNVCIDTVRRWLRKGTLRGNRIGRTWRIPESELQRLAESAGVEEPRQKLENVLTIEELGHIQKVVRLAAQRAGVTSEKVLDKIAAEVDAELCAESARDVVAAS